MSKRKKTNIIAIIIAAIFLLVSCCLFESYVDQRVVSNPNKYLETNQNVKNLREEHTLKGRITPGFLPDYVDAERTVEYLFWYEARYLGDPKYAITVTIVFPTDEALLAEIDRLEGLEGFEEIASGDCIIIGERQLPGQLWELFEPPLQDGTSYIMEYAIVSKEDRTITYTEAHIGEGLKRHETIDAQLNLLYAHTKDAFFRGVRKAPPDKSLMELSTHFYDEQTIEELANFSGTTIGRLDDEYPIECLRELHYGDSVYYRASYLGDGKVVTIEFGDDGYKTATHIYTTWLPKTAFDGLSKGQTLENVMALDPRGSYPFLYTGTSEPKESTHVTTDGYLVLISYEFDGLTTVISNIAVELV